MATTYNLVLVVVDRLCEFHWAQTPVYRHHSGQRICQGSDEVTWVPNLDCVGLEQGVPKYFLEGIISTTWHSIE